MSLRSLTIYDIFKRNDRLFKSEIAIQSENRQITFGELFDQVNTLAGWLIVKGVGKGDRIALLTKNCHQFFTLMGGTAASGAIMVPINFRLSKDEINYIINDIEPMILFFDPEFERIIADFQSPYGSIKELVAFGPTEGGFTPFDSIIDSPSGSALTISDDDPFMIMHTAAVQGRPRGALISHRNLISCSIQVASTVGLTHRDNYLNILPLFHIAGFVIALSVMHVGGKNLIISKYDPKAAIKTIYQEKVTLIGDFPPILAQLLEEELAGRYSLNTLKHVMGVEVPDMVKRFESLGHGQFWLAYGQTETMGWSCLCTNSERPGSAGKPGPLVDLKIVDEFDREVEVGKPGEILVRGPLVFKGYWREEELTKHTFRDGWHHTGDAGRLDEKGYLWFVGRKAEKELIKTGGENVYPVEVEKVILEHPGILEVSVIGVPDPKFGEGVKAVCVLKPNEKLSEKELIDFVGAKIARYKKPAFVSFVDSLPKKEDGSIDRIRVKEMYG
jgi:long-chain acyl-CoA synthetase